MIKVKIFSVGKTRESWLDQALAEYFKRLQKSVLFECIWVKDDTQLLTLIAKEPVFICLDPAGKLMASEVFAQFFAEQVEQGGSRLAFIIGGPDGLPPELKQNPKISMISLSPLTFTHQLTRLVLVEQIYRSIEILRGSKYHRGNE